MAVEPCSALVQPLEGVSIPIRRRYTATLRLLAAATVFVVLPVVGGCSSRSESYELGYDKGHDKSFAEMMINQLNDSPGHVCADVYQLAKSDDDIRDKDDYVQGCLDGLKDALK